MIAPILDIGSERVPRTRRQYISPVDEKTIGRRLRELRVRRGMTQAEVAHQLQIKQTLVSEYERGTVRLHGALLAGFAKVFNASADEILGLEQPKENGSAWDRRFLRLIGRIESLSRRDKDALLKTINNYLIGAELGRNLRERDDKRLLRQRRG